MKDYTWTTIDPHANNTETMVDYLNNHLPNGFNVICEDESYAEIMDEKNQRWAVHASGNGDFYNHRVRFEILDPIQVNKHNDWFNYFWDWTNFSLGFSIFKPINLSKWGLCISLDLGFLSLWVYFCPKKSEQKRNIIKE